MELSKKNDLRRKRRSFRKNGALVFEAFIVASVITAFWYAAWTRGFHFPNETDTSSIITTLGVTYGIIATWVIDAIWDKYKKVVVSTLRQDKDTFMLYRDERLPIALHLLIIFISLPLLVMIGMINYQAVTTGLFSIFVVSFILALFWIVIRHLENPSRSVWITERVPPEWFETDVDEHFHLGRRG